MLQWYSESTPDHPTYRAYRIARNGGIVTAEIVNEPDDARAMHAARALATRYAIELWDRARFIGRYEPHAAAIGPCTATGL